jgi:sugar diacid utilization regulator
MEVGMLAHLSHEHINNKSTDLQTITLADLQSDAVPFARAKVKLFDALNHLVTTLTLPGSLDDMLDALATLAMQSIEMDLCIIQLKAKAGDQLKIHSRMPDFDDKRVFIKPVAIEAALWERLYFCMIRGQLPQLDEQELEALNPLKNLQYKTLLPIPLIVGGEVLGLINCYASVALLCSPDEQLVLLTIANQAALAIKHRMCIAEDVSNYKTQVRAFLDDLFSAESMVEESLSRRAHLLGCDLSRAHMVVIAELTEIENVSSQPGAFNRLRPEERQIFYEGVTEQFKRCVQERYPGSLIAERDHQLICLFCMHDGHDTAATERANAYLSRTIQHIEQELHVGITAGVGNPCCTIGEYRRGYAEAYEALELGQSLHKNSCTHFNELGVFRYIHRFAQADTLCDRYLEQVALIVEYDQRKKANLLDTLEMYLECGGNMAKTSSLLDVHRNTLLQRIDRLQKLCMLDLESVPNRLPLLVAIKVHKMRTHCVWQNYISHCL